MRWSCRVLARYWRTQIERMKASFRRLGLCLTLGAQKEWQYDVRLDSQTQDAVASDRRRLMIENLFYKMV